MTQVALLDYKPGTEWVARVVAKRRGDIPGPVFVDTPSRGLVTDAEEPSGQAQAQAHNALSDAVLAGRVWHGNENAVSTAVRASRWKPMGDTRVLDRKGGADISPLVALALAMHGLTEAPPSVYEERGALVF